MRKLILSTVFLCLGISAFAAMEKKDSTAKEENSALFMNAASDSKPREISLGLPTNASSAVQIYEDGLPVSYYIYHSYPYKSWHGGVSAARTGSMGPQETALRYGEINNYVDSYNRTGSAEFGGDISYTYGMYGQNKVDVNVSGPIARGWQYALSTYQNFDPGSNHISYPTFKDRHQFYKAALSKSFAQGRGKAALVYQYVDYMSLQENFGPFVFVGDGSVKAYEGFKLGIDSYRPDKEYVSYMDFMTGEIKSIDLKEGNRDKSHHATFTLDYNLNDGAHLVFRSRFKMGTSVRGGGSLAGIDTATEESGYTYEDGKAFSGLLQKRNLIHFDTFETSVINNAEYSRTWGGHNVRFGLDYDFNHAGTTTSTSIYAHEVGISPVFLKFKGDEFYNFNTGGEYYDGYENKFAAYAKDSWKISRKVEAGAFLRLEGLTMHGKAANNIGEDKSNTRYSGFNLTKGKITTFNRAYFNFAAGADVLYRVYGGLNAVADATITRSHGNIFNFGGFYDPSDAPTDTYFIRAGISYQNEWINVLSQVNFISQSNYSTRSVFQHTLTKDCDGFPAGYTESVTLPLTYGISSIGWTTDAMITLVKGLNIHVQFTLRDPKYRDFIFSPTFSDGVTETYDFSGKSVTNLHKVELSIDPSYTYKDWRFWMNVRYISKQYINKTNSLYFKGRFETFAGIDWTVFKRVKLSLNLINLLNQKGASGLISSADLVEDASTYTNYVMSGTFIRPFTIELGISIKL